MLTSTITVKGMTCGHCEAAVKSELSKIASVTNVVVDLGTGVVAIDSTDVVDSAAVAEAIEEAGFELVS